MAAIHFNQASFEEQKQKEGVVFVDFWAAWCGPCKMVAPTIEELAETYEGKAVIGKVNVDEEQALAQAYGIMSIPTIVILKNGEEVKRISGVQPKAVYEDLINAQI